jgi:hypothetical protein
MKKILFAAAFFLLTCVGLQAQGKDTRLYELRVYYTLPGRMDALIQRFTNHTTTLFEKHGMTNVGYWIATAEPNKLLYILSFPNREARDASWKAFVNDPEWQKVAKESELDGKILEKIESTFMTLTDFSDKVKKKNIKSLPRVFELRTYTMLPGRLPNILARFRDHTTKLFEKHGMTNLPYWITQEKDGTQARLIYILAHQSEEAGKASFKAFVEDPAWIKVKEDSEKDGKIVEKLESVYMKPLRFSKIQ